MQIGDKVRILREKPKTKKGCGALELAAQPVSGTVVYISPHGWCAVKVNKAGTQMSIYAECFAMCELEVER